MAENSNIELVNAWVEEVWNSGDIEKLGNFHPPTFHNEGELTTIAETQAWHRRLRATFPDIRFTIEELLARDQRVVIRWVASGTHSGTLWGVIPATGKKITWKGVHFLAIENAKIVDVWSVSDTTAQLQQMGVKLQPVDDA